MPDDDLAKRIADRLAGLSRARLAGIERLIETLEVPAEVWINPDSDFMTDQIAEAFGETLQLHHSVSGEPFTKDKFEYALVSVLEAGGHEAIKMPRGNPGQDIEVDGERWSLKTQANTGINGAQLHISKFMELGKGAWETETDLEDLKARMLTHMESYERIFSLRCLTPNSTDDMVYELVEIPKSLLLLAEGESCKMHQSSKQTPKPGSCAVTDDDGNLLFELYFDGGTERKLQVRKIAKSSCVVHATWSFSTVKE